MFSHLAPAASEGRYRGSDLAVTAGELNAGAGVGRLGPVFKPGEM
tara:strand:+ start:4310 stop:4444 length:135 start_codon:yes stop_codon:yes gene_type:complete